MTASSTVLPATLGQLRDSGYASRSVKAEIRANLLDRLRSGEPAFPGIVGFDDTVLPELESALLAGHDLVLLGERGQGKTRIMRTLAGCWTSGAPRSPAARSTTTRWRRSASAAGALRAELGDDLPVDWRHRDDRYSEKLATPDTCVGDLVGDVDPVKVGAGAHPRRPRDRALRPGAARRTVASSRSNELPDLAERIQVALFNVLEERDIQVRGYSLRLPLDLLLVATANPEDYTNRGRIITPLKDRFGAEIRTHYLPRSRTRSRCSSRRPASSPRLPSTCVEVLARFTRGPARVVLGRPAVRACRRGSRSPRPRGVSASALRAVRAIGRSGGGRPGLRPADRRARPCSARSSSRWARRAASARCSTICSGWRLAETFRARLTGLDLSGFTDAVRRGRRRGDRRAGPGRRRARPARRGPRPVQGARPARPRRRRHRRARSPPRSSSCSRGCT